mmetsp:Transcript_15768/g.32972  ORF Transcript_15768/g.32972 Transcript_15768/m.32972 type:complete len:209 (-) Transcript_15768:476-1102(-)|eukprot:CAMPEP_0171336160 /NCGR_PEP_ID=MMETSP0878-20121228/5839_1 /TAXON_ID=67004 /ORGANISM="Thalassiosira weissflogii, Strain CCMP1336" /LENGTH=208 /DNA_ID=CAMNT_0011837569 /DNA_START=62 /DNA_END=691 /DNA_ORIENTATION=-
MTIANANSSANGNICHILPCSIDQDGIAPIAQYFHPTPIDVMAERPMTTTKPPDAGKGNDEGIHDNDDGNDGKIVMAAQFRGRGLLCLADRLPEVSIRDKKTRPASTLPDTMAGVVFVPGSGDRINIIDDKNLRSSMDRNKNMQQEQQQQPLKVVERFQQIYNWQHEHDEAKVCDRHDSERNDKYGLNAVVGWCALSHAVHDPVPVPP